LKWSVRLLLVNAVMLLIFLYSDYMTWMAVHRGLEPIGLVCAQNVGIL